MCAADTLTYLLMVFQQRHDRKPTAIPDHRMKVEATVLAQSRQVTFTRYSSRSEPRARAERLLGAEARAKKMTSGGLSSTNEWVEIKANRNALAGFCTGAAMGRFLLKVPEDLFRVNWHNSLECHLNGAAQRNGSTTLLRIATRSQDRDCISKRISR